MKLLRDRWVGFINAMRGMWIYFSTENSAWLILLFAPLSIVLGLWLGITRIEWIMVVFAIGLVTSAEILNTSIEETLDKLHPGHDPKVGKAKDLAAGGVVVAAITAVIIGVIIFAPRIWELCGEG